MVGISDLGRDLHNLLLISAFEDDMETVVGIELLNSPLVSRFLVIASGITNTHQFVEGCVTTDLLEIAQALLVPIEVHEGIGKLPSIPVFIFPWENLPGSYSFCSGVEDLLVQDKIIMLTEEFLQMLISPAPAVVKTYVDKILVELSGEEGTGIGCDEDPLLGTAHGPVEPRDEVLSAIAVFDEVVSDGHIDHTRLVVEVGVEKDLFVQVLIHFYTSVDMHSTTRRRENGGHKPGTVLEPTERLLLDEGSHYRILTVDVNDLKSRPRVIGLIPHRTDLSSTTEDDTTMDLAHVCVDATDDIPVESLPSDLFALGGRLIVHHKQIDLPESVEELIQI